MFNVTVIKGKDILKYVARIGILVMILIIFQKMLSKNSNAPKVKFDIASIINKDELISCLEQNIPIIKHTDQNEESIEEKIENIDPLRTIVANQLNVVNHIKTKEAVSSSIQEEQKENVNEDIQPQQETNEIQNSEVKKAETGLITEVLPNNVPNKFTNSYHGVQVKNETEYSLTEEMLTPNIDVNNENVLIFHTHTCESYMPSENYNYEQTGTYRTTDLNYSVARVGTELTNQLTSYGYKVLHNTTYHDWPAYSGSYGRSLETVKELLKSNTNTDVVIDLHRDAIGDYSYAPTVKIGNEQAAQMMFVIGTDGGGLEHPNWNQNLKFAVKLQEKANELYPGLFKPIILRNSRYNQHLAKAACIIEVGATGNTMEQCLNSMKYLAKVMSEVMK